MPHMIPLQLDPNTKSSAEKQLFRLFQQLPDTQDWTVMHSVHIAKHTTQKEGEADFVIVIPDKGTFVLEIKGGGISYASGRWYSTDRTGEIHPLNNPVEEAANAMHSFINHINDHASAGNILKNTVFGYGVVFPDCTIHGKWHMPDLDDAQIADADDMSDLRAYLLNLADFWHSRAKTNARVVIKPPTAEQSQRIVELLRPDTSFSLSLSSVIRSLENQTIQLTESQQDTFEGLQENERCLISGAAGTGKTVLAKAYAQQCSENGKSVALFCYNKQLAYELQCAIGDAGNICCDSFTEYMDSFVARQTGNAHESEKLQDPRKYYRNTLPELFCDAFCSSETSLFDYLIVDEAQDLMSDAYLEAMDLILDGGLKNGNWYFFMDAEKQNLYHSELSQVAVIDLLKSKGCFFAKYTLRDNCRNSAEIAGKIDSFFGSVTRCKRSGEKGADVIIKTYRRDDEQLDLLRKLLANLRSEGVCEQDITILSPFQFSKSTASRLTDISIVTDQARRKAGIYFSSISGFKGLESPVVILTDLYDFDGKQNLLYVGMSRARSALYLLIADKFQKHLSKNGGKVN